MACGPLGDEARVVERPKRARTALPVSKLTPPWQRGEMESRRPSSQKRPLVKQGSCCRKTCRKMTCGWAPNKGLHLTASSVRSSLAPSSGSR